jgi:hypothetical protein
MSELLLDDGAALVEDDGVVLVVDDWLALLGVVAGAVAAGVWLLLLFGSELLGAVCATASPAHNSNAEHVNRTFFILASLLLISLARLLKGDVAFWLSIVQLTHT